MTQVDLATYGGISFAVVALVGTIKGFWKAWVDGKEPLLALAFAVLLGVGAKLTPSMGAFADVSWIAHVVNLVLTALAAGVAHDKIVAPIIQSKPK